jgi:two-component system response regulator FlrC
MSDNKILIVEDNDNMREALKMIVEKMKFDVDTANDGKEGFDKATSNEYDLIISDMRMPNIDGLSFLKMLKVAGINTPLTFITAYGTIENAVEALKLGAVDYILKPFSAEAIEELINRALTLNNKQKNNKVDNSKDVVFMSSFMANIYAFASDIAKTDITVLITGASGTGKDMLARFIHNNSNRNSGPFVAINCAAIPENLIESELFGFEKGAFTGADSSKIGKFELANKGTLLLDEIGEMPLHLQAKLLRVIEEREVERLGTNKKVKLDLRIIATTNRDLQNEVRQGTFREDLFYRINGINIELPSLKGLKEDIIALSNFFLDKYSKLYSKRAKNLSSDAINALLNYDWPGNIRELKHTIERAVILSRNDEIIAKDLFLHGLTFSNKEIKGYENEDNDNKIYSSDKSIAEVERDLILNTLKKHRGNRTKTAEVLGITVRTLRNKLNEFKKEGIDIEEIINS